MEKLNYYECACMCHPIGAIHIDVCCAYCSYCKSFIKFQYIEEHKMICVNQNSIKLINKKIEEDKI